MHNAGANRGANSKDSRRAEEHAADRFDLQGKQKHSPALSGTAESSGAKLDFTVRSGRRGALERRLFPQPPVAPPEDRCLPDCAAIHRESRSRKNVTIQLLWEEYKQANPLGYAYSWYCELYRDWRRRLDVVMRQEHRAGEKTFVDYAGQTVPVTDPKNGEVRQAQVFVAVLGASNYTYAEATWTQNLWDWIHVHIRAFEFFDGTSLLVVPDNLKSGVKRPCYYEPELNRTYGDLAIHYGVGILPARPYRPRDKAYVSYCTSSRLFNDENWLLGPSASVSFGKESGVQRLV